MEFIKNFNYKSDFRKPKVMNENSYIIILVENKILMTRQSDQLYIPTIREVENIILDSSLLLYIGKYEEKDCYCIRLSECNGLLSNQELIDRREVTHLTDNPRIFMLIGVANHLFHWDSLNRYCGCCGNKTIDKLDERAKVCSSCGNIIYPRIAPATITAIFRGDQILLAHNQNFKEGLYSLIAGYVEPGEALEQCVEREIWEEVGIKVKNIRYFASQPWPFPDSLMMAFIAEYESGEVAVDNYEITDANWYRADNLPNIPTTDSIAGKLIRWYKEQYQ